MTEIAKSYGLALFSVAEESFKTEEYKTALELIMEIFEKNPKYIEMLSSPNIPLSKRIDALNNALKSALPREIAYFLSLMCKNGDIDKVTLVIGEYKLLYNKAKGIKTVKVTSTQPLTNPQIDDLGKKLEKITDGKVVLELKVDKNIIGGIKVELDEKVFDGSLKRRFELLKEIVSR